MSIGSGWKRVWMAAALLGSTVAPARAADEGGAAAVCVRNSSSDDISFDEDVGARNLDQESILRCGFVRRTSSSPRELHVGGEHNGNDTTECSVWVRSWTGSLLYSSTIGATEIAGRFVFNHTIPSSSIGYATLKCTLSAIDSGDTSKFTGFEVH
jgi:hypothetical protein